MLRSMLVICSIKKSRVLRSLHCLIYRPLAMRGQLMYRIGVIDQREDERQKQLAKTSLYQS
jgi:hypothetical protein